LYKVIQFSP